MMALHKGSIYSVSGKQVGMHDQVIGGLQDRPVEGQHSEEGQQSARFLKVDFLHHRAVALEITEHPLGEQSFYS